MASKKKHTTAAHKATVAAGDIFAVPVKGYGYCSLVVAKPPAPKPAVPWVFGYVHPDVRPTLEAAAEVPPLDEWGTAGIVLVAARAFASGRWPLAGRIANYVPERWPVVPEGRSKIYKLATEAEQALVLSWIETTRDEPTRTVLECHGAEPTIAQRFPKIEVMGGASYLEAALTRRAKGLRPGFWDSTIDYTVVDSSLLAEWSDWAQAARARCHDRREPAIPAGRTTDRSIAPGDWLGIPIAGGGFSPLLVVRRRAGVVMWGDAIVYGFPIVFDHYPTLNEVDHLRPEGACIAAGTSLADVSEGRWRLSGSSSRFRIEDWPFPYAAWQYPEQKERREATIEFPEGACDISIDDAELELSRGSPGNTLTSPHYVEILIGLFVNFSATLLADNDWRTFLTPELLSNWRRYCELVADPRRRKSSPPQRS